jgi:uncharacterized protein (TIGR03032 family)
MGNVSHSNVSLLDKTPGFSVSVGLEDFLTRENLTLAASSYQSGRLYLLGRHPKGGLILSEEYFRKAMGLHVVGDDLFLLTERHLVHLEAQTNSANSTFNPVSVHHTGEVSGHDLAQASDGRMIFVNTRYNCLATPSDNNDFTPVWSPPFLNGIQKGDRCHLNGLAIDGGKSAYVSGLARTARTDGWRRQRLSGGFVMDVQANKVICEGLSMPHSPRVHNGELWICNSGTGELGTIDLANGYFDPIAFCSGFIRGLAFHGNYAFVGLSRPRHSRFDGLPLHQRLKDQGLEPWTGIQIIDTRNGETAGWVRVDGLVTELYDVAVLPGVVNATANGLMPDDYTGQTPSKEFDTEYAYTA